MVKKRDDIEIRTSDVLADSNTIYGKAISFDTLSVDLGGFRETIKRGAITQELIDNADIFARTNHDNDYILARSKYGKGSLSLELRDDGLYFSFELPNTEKGNELREHIKRGEITQCSFAFITAKEPNAEVWRKENGIVYRDIYKIGYLGDVAPVYRPAYEETYVSLRAIECAKTLKEEEELKAMQEEDETEKIDETTTETEDEIVKDNETVEDETKETVEEEETKEEVIDDDTEEAVEEEKEPDDTEDVINEMTKDETEEEEEETEKEIRNNETKNHTKMTKEFRLIKAINDIANNRSVDDTAQAVVKAGAEEMRKAGVSYGGQIQLPTSELREAITVTAEGEDVVATEIYDILEPLRAKNVLVAAGAKFITGLVGDVQVPSMSASNVTWEGETVSAKDGGQTFTAVKLSPKRLTAYVDISKQFLVQDSKSAEALIRQDIINAINSKLEATILGSAAGTTTQPAGIFNGVSKTTIASFKDVCDMEAKIEDANVIGECKYVMSNKAKAALRNMAKSAKSTELVMEGGAIDGTEVLNTSNVEEQNVVYGDFSNLAIGQWGSIDLLVDPYTKAGDGQVRLVVNAFFDAKVLRNGAFAYGTTASA